MTLTTMMIKTWMTLPRKTWSERSCGWSESTTGSAGVQGFVDGFFTFFFIPLCLSEGSKTFPDGRRPLTTPLVKEELASQVVRRKQARRNEI